MLRHAKCLLYKWDAFQMEIRTTPNSLCSVTWHSQICASTLSLSQHVSPCGREKLRARQIWKRKKSLNQINKQKQVAKQLPTRQSRTYVGFGTTRRQVVDCNLRRSTTVKRKTNTRLIGVATAAYWKTPVHHLSTGKSMLGNCTLSVSVWVIMDLLRSTHFTST